MLVLIKGAGDLATGVAHRLYGVGVSVVMTELEAPTAVRRGVAQRMEWRMPAAIIAAIE